MKTSTLPSKALVEIQKILHLMKERHFGADEYVFKEGDEDHSFYLVMSGEIEISKKTTEGQSKVIAHLKPGEILGEGVLSGIVVKPATARTLTPVILMALSKEDFDEMVENDPKTGANFLLSVMTTMNHRLNRTNIKLLALYEINKLLGQYRDDLGSLAKALIHKLLAITNSREGILLLKNPFSETHRVVYASSAGMDDKALVKLMGGDPKIVVLSGAQHVVVGLKDLGLIALRRAPGDPHYGDDNLRLLALVADQAANTIESASRRAGEKARNILQQKKFTL